MPHVIPRRICDLPPDLQALALERVTSPGITPQHTLPQAFIWAKTREGYEFWLNVNNGVINDTLTLCAQ